MESALRVIYGDGFVLGKDMAMEELVGSAGLDWSKWIPGNRAAAELVAKPAGLLGLLTNSEQVITGLNTTTYNRLGRILAESIGEGRTGRATAKEILAQMGDVIDDPARALTIAVTETRRAISTASMQAYASAGVEQVEWLVAEGEGLCDACRGNSEASPIPFGDLFPSEDTEPPAHPNCRCAIKPVVSETISQDEFERLFAEYEDITLSVVADIVKYDPDQPRDERGRFSAASQDLIDMFAVEPLSESKIDAISSKMNEKITAFSDAGGITEQVTESFQSEILTEQLRETYDLMPTEFSEDNGVKMTMNALSQPIGDGAFTIAAQVEGLGTAGAISYNVIPEDPEIGQPSNLHIEYLGSTGYADGTGSALTAEAFRAAAEANLPISLEPLDASAEAYWRTIGFTADEESAYIWVTSEDVQAIVGKLQ